MPLESVVQSQIKKKLKDSGWHVVKIIQLSENGWPDLICLRSGKISFVEVKTEKGKVSELQKYRHDQLRKIGFTVIVATSKKDIECLL